MWMFCSRRFCVCSFNTHIGSQSNLETGEDLSILHFRFSVYLRKKVRQRKIWPEKIKALMLPSYSSSISASPFPERILTPGRQTGSWRRAAYFFRFRINSSFSRDYFTGNSCLPLRTLGRPCARFIPPPSCRLRRYIMLALQALQRFVNYSPKPARWSDLRPRGQEWAGLALHHEAPQARGQRLIIKRRRCISFHLIYGFHRKPVHPQHRLGHLITECLRQQQKRVSRLRSVRKQKGPHPK